MKAVEGRELVKDYGKFRAVRGISFEVKEGEIFGLIGPNSAGKTTVLRTIAMVLQITWGSITVFGVGGSAVINRPPEKQLSWALRASGRVSE